MDLSYNQLTELTGFSYRTIKRRLQEARLTPIEGVRGPGGSNLWDSTDALQALYLGSKEELDARAERARLDKERADHQEMKNAELRGELISADEVRKSAFNTGRQFRDAMLGIPNRISARLSAISDTNQIKSLLTKEIRTALVDFK